MRYEPLLCGVIDMEYINTDFSKELSSLFIKHKKRIESDKHGIHILDDETGSSFLIAKATTSSEDYRDTLIQVCGGDINAMLRLIPAELIRITQGQITEISE